MEYKEIDRRFKVVLTKAVRGNDTAVDTYTFNCGPDANSYRATAQIVEGGTSEYKSNASITIYGLGYEKLKELSFLLFESVSGAMDKRNNVEIWVDNTIVFTGNTYFISADFSNAPDVALAITGVVGRFASSVPMDNTQTDENLSAVQVFKTLSNAMGYKLLYTPGIEKIKCPELILKGSAWEQAQDLAKAVNVKVYFSLGYLRVGEVGKALIGGEPYKLSNRNGLIGYPYFNSNGVNFKSIFTPALRVGHYVELETIVPLAKGKWYVNTKTSNLSTLPEGKWESEYISYVEKNLQ